MSGSTPTSSSSMQTPMDALRQFQTITTLLASIERDSEELEITASKRQTDLEKCTDDTHSIALNLVALRRATNSLATICVVNHEVIATAVVPQKKSDGITFLITNNRSCLDPSSNSDIMCTTTQAPEKPHPKICEVSGEIVHDYVKLFW